MKAKKIRETGVFQPTFSETFLYGATAGTVRPLEYLEFHFFVTFLCHITAMSGLSSCNCCRSTWRKSSPNTKSLTTFSHAHDWDLGMGTADRFICDTGLSIAVNQSKTRPPSTQFGFLCMHRVPGGVLKLSAPTSSLASQCLPSATIKQPFQNLLSLVPCPLSLCSEAF